MKYRRSFPFSCFHLLLAAVLGVASAGTRAKVSPEEAEKLGTVLTPMGAIREGNADGTIPPFSGHILGAPDWVDYKGSGTHFPNPYPDEKPLFTITAENYTRYAENLTDGQIELFRKYPTFAMPVYPTKRDFRYNDKVYRNTKLNAVTTELVSGGNGVGKVFHGVPFPIPKNGVELIWNHQASPNYESTDGALDSLNPPTGRWTALRSFLMEPEVTSRAARSATSCSIPPPWGARSSTPSPTAPR
jgi:hypothetical protein